MDLKLFNWSSRRAQFARYGHALSPWVFGLEILTVVLLVAGLGLLIVMSPLGWALVGLAALPAMIVQWYKYELRDVPVTKERTIDGRMEADLLAIISRQPSPKELALALQQVNGGLFFEVRFGVGGGFL